MKYSLINNEIALKGGFESVFINKWLFMEGGLLMQIGL